jgi:hypothetical protein
VLGAGSGVQAAAMAQQATAAPAVSKPRPPSATRSPQFESPDNRRTRALALRAFHSVGQTLQVRGISELAHNKGEPDRDRGNQAHHVSGARARLNCP